MTQESPVTKGSEHPEDMFLFCSFGLIFNFPFQRLKERYAAHKNLLDSSIGDSNCLSISCSLLYAERD